MYLLPCTCENLKEGDKAGSCVIQAYLVVTELNTWEYKFRIDI